jgi:hypothetical protein
VSEWRKCSDTLPLRARPMLVVAHGVVQWVTYRWVSDHWEPTIDELEDAPPDAFSHWMPLPEPPK